MSKSQRRLPSQLGAVFTAAEARAAGVHARRLTQPGVIRLARGIYARSEAVALTEQSDLDGPGALHPHEHWRRSQRVRARALAQRLHPDQFFSHRTAAALWNLPVEPEPKFDPALEIASHFNAHGRSRAGIRGRTLRKELVTVVTHQGLRLTDPATTWALVAPSLSRPQAIALGDAVIHRSRIGGTRRLQRAPLADHTDLAAAAHIRGRLSGVLLRTMLADLSPHSASPPETHLRLLLAEWDIPTPELDWDVRTATGEFLGTSEIAFPGYRIALEYEGSHHFTLAKQYLRDIEKYQRYAEHGWHVIRVTSQLLYVDRCELRRQLFAGFATRAHLVAE